MKEVKPDASTPSSGNHFVNWTKDKISRRSRGEEELSFEEWKMAKKKEAGYVEEDARNQLKEYEEPQKSKESSNSKSSMRSAGDRRLRKGHGASYYKKGNTIIAAFKSMCNPFTVNHHTTLVKGVLCKEEQEEINVLVQSMQRQTLNLMMVVDFFQILGLYWITANSWPLPYPWVIWTRWWAAFNVDLFSFLDGGALAGATGNVSISKWGSYSGYAMVFAFPFVLVTAMIAALYWRYSVDILPTYSKRWHLYQPVLLSVTLQLLNFLYLPTGIAAFRALYCKEDINPGNLATFGSLVMAADGTQICYSGAHLFVFLCVLFLYLPIFVGLPIFIKRLIADSVVYELPADHEKRLQAWEITHMLRIDNHLTSGQVWLLAPHTRPSVYYRVWMLSLKGVLLLLYTFCRGNGVGNDNSYKTTQAILFWLTTLLFSLRFLPYFNGHVGPFRLTSSNTIFYILLFVLCSNTTIGVFNSYGVQNVILVNSMQTILLTSVTFGGFAVIFIVMCVVACNPYTVWPSVRSLHRIESHATLNQLVKRWLKVVYTTLRVREAVLAAPTEIADANALTKCIRDLRSCWLSARHKGSIFELIIGELVEELIIVHDLRKASLCRANYEWDEAYKDAVKDGTFTKRNSRYRLMAPRKKRILTKLLALRILQQRDPLVEDDLIDAMTDNDFKLALRQVTMLERATKELLEHGFEFDKRQDNATNFSVAVSKTNSIKSVPATEGANRVASTGDFVATAAELEHMEQIEDALYRWENIIDTVEQYHNEQPFMRRMFTIDRTEQWYGYRNTLLTQLSNFKHFFGDEDESEMEENYSDSDNEEEMALISEKLCK